MAKATLEPPNPPDVPVPSGDEAPPQPSFDDSFGAALDHALAPPKTSPAFDTAFDAAVDHVRSQVAWNPVEAFKSVYEGARGGTASIYEGLANTAAYLFDPSLKYANRSQEDLQSGINAAQARYDELAKEEYPEGASEYDVSRKQVQLSELRSNIEAQKHALARQVEPEYQPSLPENIAGGLRASAQESATIQAQERGEIPIPDKGLVNRLLDQPFVVRPNPVYQSTIPGAVASNVGGMIPYALGAMAAAPTGPVGEFAVESALFGGSSAQGGIEEAKAAGKDEEVQAAAAQWGMASGPVQAAAFRFLNLAPWLRGQGSRTVGEYVKSVAKNAAIGAAGGEAQRVYDNIVAQATGIDPNRKMTEGLGQNLLTNAIGMALFTGGIEAPSLAMRSLGRAGNLSVYQGKPGPESGAPEVGAPTTGPTEPVTPADADRNQARAQAQAEAFSALTRQDVGPAAVPPEPTATTPTTAPAAVPEEPITKRDIRSVLSNLVDTVGPRANFLLADARSLPMRYRSALAEQGQTPENFKAFFDRDTGDFVVNHRNIDNEAELHDAIIRNFIPETFRDKATIVPISSWHDEAAGDAGVATMVGENANANTSVGGLYSTASGQVYLNVPKLLEAPDPMREALKTAVHEISVHQGIRTWFDDPHYMASFLNRVYNGMEQSGMGNHVAGAFGTDMEGLARQYGYGKENPDGSWQMDAIDRAKVGEELLARYAERFDPNELDKAPGVIQKAIDYVRTGLRRFQGLDFDRTDAFHFIRDAWRATDPQRDPLADTAALARRIGKSYVSPELESKRAIAADTRELNHAQQGVSPTGRGTEPERGRGNEDREIIQSSNRLGAYAQAAGRVIADGELSRHTSGQLAKPLAEEHDILIPRGADRSKYLIKLTKLGGFGPYGQHVEPLGAQPGGDPKTLAAHAIAGKFIPGPATADQYLERLRLSNVLFDSRYNLEGFQHDPSTALWQVVTSQPRYNNARPADTTEIVHYMEQRGFKPVDDRTFYDPSRKVLVADAHSGNVLVDKDTGRVIPIDVAPQHVEGKMASDLEKIVNDPNRQAAIGKQLDDVHRMLLAQGIDLKSEGGLEQAQYAADQQLSEEAEQNELQQRATQGVLNAEERARLDELEFGAFFRRDIEEELGPEAKGLPEKILTRAQETLDIMRPTQGVAEAARKVVIDPNRPEAVRLAAASPDQLLYDRTGESVWEPESQAIYDQHKGDLDKIAADLMSGLRDDDISAYTYKKVTNDVAVNREAAEGNEVRQAQLDAFQANLDDWFIKKGTNWGQEGAARANAWFAKDGILTRYRRQLNDFLDKRIRRDPVFKDAAARTRDLASRTTDQAITDAKPILEQAQRLRNFRLPAEYAKAMAEDLTARFNSQPGAAVNKPMLEQLFKRFRNTIEAKIKEKAVDMGGIDPQKISATTTIRDALSQWHWLDEIWNQTVNELKNEGPNALFFQRVQDAMDVPFSQTQLARAVREQKVSIADMVKEHRSRIATTVKTLAQALTERTGLTPEHAQAVEKAIDTYVRTAVDAKTRAEFDKIIARANNGKPSTSGRPVAMKRFIDLVNMGAFNDHQVANALAPAFGLRSFDPKFAGDISALGNRLEDYKQQGRGSLQMQQVLMDMERRLAEQRFDSMTKMGKAGDLAMNVYMGNILSGVPTHVIALFSDLFNGFGNVLSRLVSTRRFEAIPQLLYATVKGFTRGWDSFKYVIRTGYDPASNVNPDELLAGGKRYLSLQHTLDTDPSQRILQKYGLKVLGAPIDWYKYIGRSITAAHSLMYEGFSAPIKWLTAYDQIMKDGTLPRHKALDRANEMMFGGQAELAAAQMQAKAEGLTGQEARLRTQDLINEQIPAEIRDFGDFYGRHTMFTQEPQGIMGIVARALKQITREVPYAKTIIPFTNVVSNIINNSLDYSPVGLWRARSMDSVEKFVTAGGREKFSDEQINMLRHDMLFKGFFGIGVTTAFYLLAKQMGWQINGPGPSDYRKKQQLQSAGWIPNSIKFGNVYVPYETTPLAIPMAIIGAYEDANRYEKKEGLDRLLYMASNAGHVVMDRSYLKGMTDFLDAFHGQSDAEGGTRAAAAQLAQMKNFVPVAGSNFIRQFYQQWVDPKSYQPNKGAPVPQQLGQLLLRDFPMIPSMIGEQPKLNILGEPVLSSPETKRYFSTQRDDEVWNFINQKNLVIGRPTPGTKLLGKTMTPEQIYEYAKYRGQHIKEALAAQQPHLQGIDDPAQLENAVQKIERHASKQALGDMIKAGH